MFFFRIDLGQNQGLGHYNRVKALIKNLEIKKYKIIVDKTPSNLFFKNDEKNFLSIYKNHSVYKNEIQDAQYFIKLTKCNIKTSIVIKDSYRLGFVWEKYVNKYCKKIISIEDFINLEFVSI